MERNAEHLPEEIPGRAAYEPPRLRRLGSIADVTRGTGTGSGPLAPGGGGGATTIYGNYSADQVSGILNGQGRSNQ